jgi:hypothetical protein
MVGNNKKNIYIYIYIYKFTFGTKANFKFQVIQISITRFLTQ